MNPILLQFITRGNSASTIITLIIVGGLLLFITLSGGRRRVNSSPKAGSKGRGKGGYNKGGYNKRLFRKLAKQHNLEPHHLQILQKTIKVQKINNPDRLFNNGDFLDQTLQKLIKSLKSSSMPEEGRNRIISEVYEIKQRIANASFSLKQLGKMEQTRGLRSGQEITIYSEFLPPTKSQILANAESHLIIATPMNANGSPIKYPIAAVLKIRLIAGGNNVYAFKSKLKQARVINGVESMMIDHSSKMTHNQLRKDTRREASIVAYFQQIKIIGEGDRKQAVLNKKNRSVGQIEDISRGGCAMYSPHPMQQGDLLKIRFNLGSSIDISVFGKVKTSRPRTPVGALMHIAFTRISIDHLNEIQSHVFGFSEN